MSFKKKGKTSMLVTFTSGTFPTTLNANTQFDFKQTHMKVNDKEVSFQVWDTAGQEQFRTITHSFYRDMHGLILMYDVSDSSSYDSLEDWYRDIQKLANEAVYVVLVGNKCDLITEKVIPYDQGKKYADSKSIGFFETSSKQDVNIEDPFRHLLDQITKSNRINNNSSGQKSTIIKLTTINNNGSSGNEPAPKKKSPCSLL